MIDMPPSGVSSENGMGIASKKSLSEAGFGTSVGILVGTPAEVAALQPCAAQLEEWGIPCEFKVATAHRKPDMGQAWASSASKRGVKVIVAACGKVSQLGYIAATFASLPVISVPIDAVSLSNMRLSIPNDKDAHLSSSTDGFFVAHDAYDAAVLAAKVIGLDVAVSK